MVDFANAIVDDGTGTTTLLEMLKQFLGINPGDVAQDEALARAIDLAGDTIEKWLDRIIVKRPVDEYFPHHFDRVVLHNMPVDTDQPLIVNLNGEPQTDYQIYLMRGKTAHLTRSGQPIDVPMDWRTYDQVTVTYTAGYDPIPSDLAYGITLYSSMVYAADGTGSIPSQGSSGALKSFQLYDVGAINYDVGSTSEGGASALQTGMIPQNVAQSIQFYRRLSV